MLHKKQLCNLVSLRFALLFMASYIRGNSLTVKLPWLISPPLLRLHVQMCRTRYLWRGSVLNGV